MIGENIQLLRKKAGLTQEALAEKVNVSRQTIAKWESGESVPDLALAARLAEALDVSLDELAQAPFSRANVPERKGLHMFGPVTVGDKGQIVIPVKARRVFNIQPGDQLMVLGDEERGLALVGIRFFMMAAEVIQNGGDK